MKSLGMGFRRNGDEFFVLRQEEEDEGRGNEIREEECGLYRDTVAFV